MPKVVPGYKAEARRRILDAAQQLFLTKGYRRTTMDDVAHALGVSKGALYQYYRSKVALLREIQAESRVLSRRWMDESLESSTGAARELADRLEKVFRQSVRRDHVALFLEILGESTHDDEIRKALRDDHRADLTNLKRFLVELVRRRQLASPVDADTLAFMVIALFEGAVFDLNLGLDPAGVYRRLGASMDFLLGPGAAASARPA